MNAHPSHSDSPGPIHRACPCWLDHPCSLSFIDVCVLLISGSRFQSAQTGMCTFLLHQMLTSVEDARQKKKKNLSGTDLEKCHTEFPSMSNTEEFHW